MALNYLCIKASLKFLILREFELNLLEEAGADGTENEGYEGWDCFIWLLVIFNFPELDFNSK